jgi:hypothetical protein
MWPSCSRGFPYWWSDENCRDIRFAIDQATRMCRFRRRNWQDKVQFRGQLMASINSLEILKSVAQLARKVLFYGKCGSEEHGLILRSL